MIIIGLIGMFILGVFVGARIIPYLTFKRSGLTRKEAADIGELIEEAGQYRGSTITLWHNQKLISVVELGEND